MKLQGKNKTIIIIVEYFPSFSACKIIENVTKIDRNVTFHTRYWTTGNTVLHYQ